MSCPCEGCKQERSERQRARLQRRLGAQIAAARVAEVWRKARAAELIDQALGAWVRERAQEHLEGVWHSVDGPIRVQAMGMAHLCFALAKCEQGGAGMYGGRARGSSMLKAELLRRLAGITGTDWQRAEHEREAEDRGARAQAGHVL